MGEVIFSVLLFIAILLIGVWIEAASCSSKWRASGFQTSYGPIQGCLISKDGRTWIPEENYRDIP